MHQPVRLDLLRLSFRLDQAAAIGAVAGLLSAAIALPVSAAAGATGPVGSPRWHWST
ncbi:MAG TPA: hypothetical protein VGG16_21825 [Streptosporangiaceae bacterium]